MIGVIGHFEHRKWAYSPSAIKNIMRFWAYPLKAFGGDTLIMVDVDQIELSYGDGTINFKVYPTLHEALDDHEDVTFVFLEAGKGQPLRNFKHPESDTLYVFGSDYDTLDVGALRKLVKKSRSVQVGTPVDKPLWAHEVAAIVLYDQYAKG